MSRWSTLLRILVGLNTGFQGDVMVNNIPLEKKNLKTIRKNVGYVFQDADSQLFMSTVFDDVAFAPRNYGMSEAEVNEKTMEALKVVHWNRFISGIYGTSRFISFPEGRKNLPLLQQSCQRNRTLY